MSSDNCLHIIQILNLQENEIIPHQFLLIKGKIEYHNCVHNATLQCCCENVEILTTGICEDSGKFKIVLNLYEVKGQEFLIKFQYCNAAYELNLKYAPNTSIYRIQPLLILAQDESLEEEKTVKVYQEIIDVNLLLIQSVYGEKLNESCKRRLSFVFNGKCEVFQSSLSKAEMWQKTENELWTCLAKELLQSPWGIQDHLKFVAFIACSKYLGEEVLKSGDFSYANIRKHIRGHAALGTGGLALFSSTYFYAWPREFKDILKCFSNSQSLDLTKEPDDSNYRKTRAGAYASSLGAVCHEIGHIFDLGHDREGVMGSNFDYINHMFTLKKKTEYLPERIIQKSVISQNGPRPRFTQLKRTQVNNFLDCYRQQKTNDYFYFTPNSAVILSHHPWIRGECMDFVDNNDFQLEFNPDKTILKSLKYPLKIIEIRTESNSLVTEWLEFQKNPKDSPVLEYDLRQLKQKSLKDSYIFVMSRQGHCKKLEI